MYFLWRQHNGSFIQSCTSDLGWRVWERLSVHTFVLVRALSIRRSSDCPLPQVLWFTMIRKTSSICLSWTRRHTSWKLLNTCERNHNTVKCMNYTLADRTDLDNLETYSILAITEDLLENIGNFAHNTQSVNYYSPKGKN